MIARRGFLLGCLAAGLSACGGKSESDGPPSIRYGDVACERCRMVIAEERHAAAIVTPGGATQLFDDTGEMVATVQDQGLGTSKVWAHDYEAKTWLDATTATYVSLPDRATPMGSGIVAFAEASRAESYAAEVGGWSKGWAALLTDWHLS